MPYRTDKEIGDRILTLLGSRTQKDLADAVDMDPTALNKVIAGKRTLTGTELILLARELSVSPQSLLAEEEEPVFVMRSNADAANAEAVQNECSSLIDAYLRLEALIR